MTSPFTPEVRAVIGEYIRMDSSTDKGLERYGRKIAHAFEQQVRRWARSMVVGSEAIALGFNPHRHAFNPQQCAKIWNLILGVEHCHEGTWPPSFVEMIGEHITNLYILPRIGFVIVFPTDIEAVEFRLKHNEDFPKMKGLSHGWFE